MIGSGARAGGFRRGLETVHRASYAEWAAVEDVGVDHRGPDVAVAEQGLEGSDVGSVLEEMGGEGVA